MGRAPLEGALDELVQQARLARAWRAQNNTGCAIGGDLGGGDLGAQLEQRREWLGVGWPVLPESAPPKAAKRALRGAGAERGRSQGGTWTMVAAAVAPGDFVHAMDQSARAGSLRRPSCGTAPLGAALSKRLGLWAGGWPRRRVSRCEPGHFERAAAPVSPMMMSLKSRSKLSELGSIRDEPPSIAQPAGRSTRGGAR